MVYYHHVKQGMIAVGLLGALWPVSAGAMEFAPHRVTYQLALAESDKSAALDEIKGRSVFTLRQDCDGWKSDEDYAMQMRFEGGGEVFMASLFSSYENEAGDLFSFTIDEQSSFEPAISFDGFASRADEGNGEAFFSIEPDEALLLPETTYFPIQHSFEILERAQQGDTFFSAHIFFGAKPDEALKKTSVVIGKKAMREGQLPSSPLLMTDYYPIQIAYFDPSSTTGLPSYEILFHMQDNGVVPYYIIDYGDFSLEATLSEIEAAASPSCN